MARLVVRSNQSAFVSLVILALIFVPLSLGNFWQLRHGFRLSPVLWGLLPVLLFAPVLYLARRGHSRSVKIFTEDGLTRNDGCRFSWADLDFVIDQIHRNPRAGYGDRLWRTEIHFKDGQCAWLIPSRIANRPEVERYVAALLCEHKTVRV